MKDKLLKMWQENKKLVIAAAAAVVVLVVVLIVAVTSNPLYGTYKTDELLYISPLNSGHTDLYEESFESVKLSGSKFVVTAGGIKETIKKPEVKTEEMTEELLKELQNAIWGDGNEADLTKVQKVHYIYDADGKRTEYLLLETEDDMWFVKYYIVNEKMDIWHIIDLED